MSKEELAKNTNTPTEILIKLSKDEYWFVREDVAKNTNTPIETLIELSNDKEWIVRGYVTTNPTWVNSIKS
jgi:prophage antirepressor-like protein